MASGTSTKPIDDPPPLLSVSAHISPKVKFTTQQSQNTLFATPDDPAPYPPALLALCGVREYPDFLQLVRFLPISSSVQDIPQVLVFSSLVPLVPHSTSQILI